MDRRLFFVGLGTFTVLSSCQTSGTSNAPTASPSTVVLAKSIDEFYGTWKGSWRRLSGGQSGDAQINIRSGASTFANADFILNGGDLRFSQAPDFKDGRLIVSNGEAMQMKMELLEGDKMYISYSRFGKAGEYMLTKG